MIINRDINGNEVLKVTTEEDIILNGDINSNADVKLISETGSVTIHKDINSQATLLAIANESVYYRGEFNSETSTKLISKNRSITVGIEGQKKNVNQGAKLSITAKEDVIFHHTDLNGKCDVYIVSKNGSTSLRGDLNSESKLFIISENDIDIIGDINGNVRVELISTQGTIRIHGHIHSNSTVKLTAAKNIKIGKEIEGNLSVVARCEGQIILNGKINNHAYVGFRAHQGIEIHGDISDHSHARFSIVSGNITIHGNISDNSKITYWPNGSLNLHGSGLGRSEASPWVQEHAASPENAEIGSWWNNWFWSYGFVSNRVYRPNTYQKLVEIVANLYNAASTSSEDIRVKAAGGSWSFSDIILPHNDINEVKNISIFERGKNNTVDLTHVLRHMRQKDRQMDIYPYQIVKSLEHSSYYDTTALRKRVKSGIDLKPTQSRYWIIDTKNLCSSLQSFLTKKHVDVGGERTYRYWVEAGITMTDLNKLLDNNYPRLAIEASGGSPGATLAGTISTATHGGEFDKPLLIDRVLAIHLFGLDGQEWWIEGSNRVIEKEELQGLYPNISDDHFISSETWDDTSIDADDFLKTVVTSMGTMGIIHSVVIEVVPQFSIQQVTYKHQGWKALLDKAGLSIDQLTSADSTANIDLMNFLIDGVRNGTGISAEENQYMDLAINPISKSCWIVNRKFISRIANEENGLDLISNYMNSLSSIMAEGANSDGIFHSGLFGRLLDFLSIPRDSLGLVFGTSNISNFLTGVGNFPMLLSSLMAHLEVKAMWNATHESDANRGHKFLSDILEGILDALQGTYEEPKSEISGLSYKVGAIGWPQTGLPGRGFEVAVSPSIAFTYVNDLLNLIDEKAALNKVFLGYISIRLCPNTRTLMGMQQFSPYSVMVEIVAHRTPEANEIFDSLIDFTKDYSHFRNGEYPPFHWGLETEKIDRAYLENTPFGNIYKNGLTRLAVFNLVKERLRNGHPPLFDNTFVARMGF